MTMRMRAYLGIAVCTSLFVQAHPASASATPWTVAIDLAAASSTTATLTIGLDAAATNGLDAGLGEEDLPPGDAPFAAFSVPGTLVGSLIDIRHTGPANQLTWAMHLNTSSGDYPIEVTWALPVDFPADGTIRLQDATGAAFGVNMRAPGALLIADVNVDRLFIVYDPNADNLYDPPTVNAPVLDQLLTAGDPATAIDLESDPVFVDPNADPLTYSATTSDNAVATAIVMGTMLYVTPVADGTATITVKAADVNDGMAETSFLVTVSPPVTNLAPLVVNPIAGMILKETDPAETIELAAAPKVFTDPNGDVLTFDAASSDVGVVTVGVVGSQLTLTPVGPGSAYITVTATDPDLESASVTFDVTIVDVIVASAFTLDLTVTNNQSESTALGFGLDPAATDGLDTGLGEEELPPLGTGFDGRFQVEGLAGLGVDLRSNALTGPQVWHLFVQPTAGGLPIVFEWDPLQLPPDGVVRLQGTQGGLLLDVNMRAQSSLIEDDLTEFLVIYDATAENLFDPPVVINPIGDPAALTAGGDPFVVDLDDAPAFLSPVFADPNLNPLFYSASSTNHAVAAAYVAGSLLTVMPVAAGTATIVVKADDGYEGVATTTFAVTVQVAQQPLPPVAVTPIPFQTLVEGGADFSLDLALPPEVFSDPNGDPLTYSASSSDDAVATASLTASLLTVTPVAAGFATIEVSADDGNGGVTTTSFQVVVLDVIAAEPFVLGLTVTSNTGNNQFMSLGLDASATAGLDPALGEEELPPVGVGFDARFKVGGLNGLATDMRFNGLTGTEVWNLKAQVSGGGLPLTLAWDPGQLPAAGVIRLRDAQGGAFVDVNMRARSNLVTEVLEFHIVYDAAAINTFDPPVLENPIAGPATLTAGGDPFVFDLLAGPVFTDPNGDPLFLWAISSNHSVASAYVTGSELFVTPVGAGTATITVTADDGKEGVAETSFEVTVEVASTPLPPQVAGPIPDLTLIEGGDVFSVDLTLPPEVFIDPNGDLMTFTATSSDVAVATVDITNSTVTVSPVFSGAATITLTANDGNGGTATTDFQVTVLDVTTAPGFALDIDVANSGTGVAHLALGLVDGATDGLDPALGEQETAPLPPTAVFDARLKVVGTIGSLTDLRGRQLTEPVTWEIQVQKGVGGFPITLTWDPGQLPPTGVIRLQGPLGSTLNVNMRSTSSQSRNRELFRIVYDPAAVNTFSPPVVASAIADQSLTGGSNPFVIDLAMDPVFTDPESDPLTYTAASSNNAVATVGLVGGELTVTPLGQGTATITVTANDGNEGTATDVFVVAVAQAATPLPPVVANPIPNLALSEDSPAFQRNLTAAPAVFSDPNGDVLTFVVSSSNTTVATATLSSLTILRVTPVADGTATITVTASDPDPTTADATATFQVTVAEVVTIGLFTANLTVTNAGTGSQVLTYGFDSEATSGIDTDLGELELPPKPPSTVFDVRFEIDGKNGSVLDLRPASASEAVVFRVGLQAGADGLPFTFSWNPLSFPQEGTMRMQDPAGGILLNINMRAFQTFQITNANINPVHIIYDPTAPNLYHPPTVANPIAAQTLVAAGSDFVRDLAAAPAVFTDPDGDPLTFTATSTNGTIAAATVSGTTLTVDPKSVGVVTITVKANDGNEGVAETSFAVTVQAPAQNLAPDVSNPLADLEFEVGDNAVAIDLTNPVVFTDPNGDVLTFTAVSSSTGIATATLSGTTLTISPVGAGTATVTVTADDGPLTTDETFTVTVTQPGAGPGPEAWTLVIGGRDTGTGAGSVTIGLADGATNGIDAGLNELQLPPLPPAGNFDMRSTSNGGMGRDLRDATLEQASWTINFQTSTGGAATLSWDVSQLPASVGLRMTDPFGGLIFTLDMRSQSSYTSSPGITSVVITYQFIDQSQQTLTYSLGAGWNIVSLPVEVADGALSTLFPDAVSAFRWNALYQQVTTLNTCEGYWVNLTSGDSYTLAGPPVQTCSNSLPIGWSIVGVPWTGSNFTEIGQSPVSILISAFGWTGQLYQQALGAMAHGFGYWVNLSAAGTLTVNPPSGGAAKPAASPAPALEPDGPVLWARRPGDTGVHPRLQLGVRPEAVVALPPRAPAGVDVRVLVDGVESWQAPVSDAPAVYPVYLQGADRLELGWDVPAGHSQRWSLVVDGAVVPLTGTGSIEVVAGARVELQTGGAIPQIYALNPNYPNPFNPSTTIGYQLPADGEVSLRVFDTAGQVVRALVDGRQAAGTYSVVWDGRNSRGAAVANGVYFYQLRSGRFETVRKMLLMK